MKVGGNLLPHYAYRLATWTSPPSTTSSRCASTPGHEADLHVVARLDDKPADLPASSPFRSAQDARRFAGPLPWTSTTNPRPTDRDDPRPPLDMAATADRGRRQDLHLLDRAPFAGAEAGWPTRSTWPTSTTAGTEASGSRSPRGGREDGDVVAHRGGHGQGRPLQLAQVRRRPRDPRPRPLRSGCRPPRPGQCRTVAGRRRGARLDADLARRDLVGLRRPARLRPGGGRPRAGRRVGQRTRRLRRRDGEPGRGDRPAAAGGRRAVGGRRREPAAGRGSAVPAEVVGVTHALPVATASLDSIFVTFAAHEVRARRDQRALFGELRRAPPRWPPRRDRAPPGPRHFAVYGPGAFHFQPAGTWIDRAAEAGFAMDGDRSITPFVHRMVWRR